MGRNPDNRLPFPLSEAWCRQPDRQRSAASPSHYPHWHHEQCLARVAASLKAATEALPEGAVTATLSLSVDPEWLATAVETMRRERG